MEPVNRPGSGITLIFVYLHAKKRLPPGTPPSIAFCRVRYHCWLMFFRSSLAMLAVVFMLQPASAQIPTAPANLAAKDVADIRNIIIGQIDAFRKDDAEKAFSFAAPELKKIFRTPDVFLYMVRKSYKSVYRPQKFDFRTIQRIDGKVVQPVTVIGPSGVTETALYIMEIQPDGTWRIGACIMAQEPGNDT
jgi:hypothetical protein